MTSRPEPIDAAVSPNGTLHEKFKDGDILERVNGPTSPPVPNNLAKCIVEGRDLMLYNPCVRPMLTDLYQITMAYAYFKAGNKMNEHAVFDLFFRKNPFGGEFTIFAGLDIVLGYLHTFKFSDEDVEYLRNTMDKSTDPEFFKWLQALDCRDVKIYAQREGSIVFPRVPLLRVEGPLGITQLLETTLLNAVNYPSLVATNAVRMRLAAGPDKKLLEFGLRRAQGPDGGMSASRYSYLGGFDGTSNVLAGQVFGIKIGGTHAHSFVASFSSLHEVSSRTLVSLVDGKDYNITDMAVAIRTKLNYVTNDGELAAFIAYAHAFPNSFLALVDTYDTLGTGVPNFLVVAAVLANLGYKPVGIRLDSGDLAYLSKATRKMFETVGETLGLQEVFGTMRITASNDINEKTLYSLAQQGHSIDTFGIGTKLVTCEDQPALGCVYKLVEVNGKPRIKLSNDIEKVTIPGRKEAYRIFGSQGYPVVDAVVLVGDSQPMPGQPFLCRHPFLETKRVQVIPSHVVPLHRLVWDGRVVLENLSTLEESRQNLQREMASIRKDHTRALNPTPYKVSVSAQLYEFIHNLWLSETPIRVIN